MKNKPDFYIAAFSGGKDSTAMVLRLLEEKRTLDMILFLDTGLEFPAMYRHIRKFEEYTGKEVKVVASQYTFEYLFCKAPINRRYKGKFVALFGKDYLGYGWPGPRMRWCTSRLKDVPREQFLRELRKKYNVRMYVGIAADEGYRLTRPNNQREECIHPLVEWNMTEAECLQYCYDRGFDWEGLYTIFSRVSCWCCPLQSLAELRKLYENFSGLWEQLKRWDDMTWRKFRADYSVKELEVRFELEKEFLRDGKSIRNKAFFDALKERLVSMNGTDSHG